MRLLLSVMGALCLAMTPVAAAEENGNNVEVIKPPIPEYPWFAATIGLTGYCETRFDIESYSTIRLRYVACTQKAFCYAAERAVKEAELRVVDVPGTTTPGRRTNIVYPLVFVFEDTDRHPKTEGTQRCRDYPVS